MPLNSKSQRPTWLEDGNQSFGESNTESNEKITQQLNSDNEWLQYLESGEPLPTVKKTHNRLKPWLVSPKQRRALWRTISSGASD